MTVKELIEELQKMDPDRIVRRTWALVCHMHRISRKSINYARKS